MSNDPQTVNERMGYTVIGPEATDDEVQAAADMADGKNDGIAGGPESDVQAAISVYRAGKMDALDKLELTFLVAKAVFTKGERHVLNEDWAMLAVILGPAAVDLIKKVAALF